eukprot:m.184864 g.184864  ORF g.184864 m.184864 type:complete len:102 (-) comp16247_c0_seq1:196-501(-)
MARDIKINQQGTVIALPVLQKLMAFMVALLLAPIASFYAVRRLFIDQGYVSGEATTAAAFGATFTVVLIMAAYVAVAFLEEDDDDANGETKPKTKAEKKVE